MTTTLIEHSNTLPLFLVFCAAILFVVGLSLFLCCKPKTRRSNTPFSDYVTSQIDDTTVFGKMNNENTMMMEQGR